MISVVQIPNQIVNWPERSSVVFLKILNNNPGLLNMTKKDTGKQDEIDG